MVEAKTAAIFEGRLAGMAADLASLDVTRKPVLGLEAGHQVGADKPGKEAPATWVAKTQANTVAKSMADFLERNRADSSPQSHAEQVSRGSSPKKPGPGLG